MLQSRPNRTRPSNRRESYQIVPSTMAADRPYVQWRHRITCTTLVLVVAALVSSILSALGYCVGTNTESNLHFFEPRRPPTLDEACVACPVEYALHSNEANDVIFIGDSTCRVAIDPSRFHKLTGLQAYNLASEGGIGPTGLLITAEAYLSRHPSPRVIVLSMSPLAFEGSANEIAGKMQTTMLERFAANYGPEVPGFVPWRKGASYFIKRGALATWMTLSQLTMSNNAQDVRDSPLIGSTYSFRAYQQGVHQQRGYAPLPGSHGERRTIEFPGEPVKVDDEWDRNVRHLTDDCERRRIPLIIRLSPMPRDLAQIKDFRPLDTWSQNLKNYHPHVIVGTPLLLWYAPELCWDQIHLNKSGGSAYLGVLASDVLRAIGSPSTPK